MANYSGLLSETARRDADLFFPPSVPQSIFDEWEAHLPERPSSARREGIDLTPLAREIGLLPPVALTEALWEDIQAIPPGFDDETVLSRLTTILRHAFFAIAAEGDSEKADSIEAELLVFPVSLPTVGQEISDYPVVLLFRPGQTHKPTFTLMTPEEAAGIRLVNGPASAE